MKSFGFIFIAIVSFPFSVQATSGEEVQEKTKAAVEAAASYTADQKAEAEKSMEESLSAMSKKITELKDQAKDLTGEAKQKINAQISSMEKEQASLKKDFAKLKKSSGNAWTQMKIGFGKAMDNLSEGYNKAKSEFKKDSK